MTMLNTNIHKAYDEVQNYTLKLKDSETLTWIQIHDPLFVRPPSQTSAAPPLRKDKIIAYTYFKY